MNRDNVNDVNNVAVSITIQRSTRMPKSKIILLLITSSLTLPLYLPNSLITHAADIGIQLLQLRLSPSKGESRIRTHKACWESLKN
jgi:hypothetical protein